MARLYAIVFLPLLLLARPVWSQQTDCEETITRATDEFNAGHFYSIPAILNECLKSFTREQKQRAYLLLTQTYLLLDDPIGAEKSYLEILRANPEFVPDEQLHAIDIVYLSKRYTATPKFSLFMRAGSNVSPMRVILDNDIMADGGEKYSFQVGYQLGGGGEYALDDHLRLRLELNYLHTAYRSLAVDNFERDTKTIIDRQSWLTIPAYLCYTDNRGAYRPYVYAGYSLSHLLGDHASISTVKATAGANAEEQETETFPVESPDFDFRRRREKFNQSLVFGGGLKYKIGLDFLFVEARYCAGLKNIVNPDRAFGDYSYGPTDDKLVSSMTPATEYGHRDDFLRLDNISVSVGYVRPLYKPRELKRARTRSVLRKMKR